MWLMWRFYSLISLSQQFILNLLFWVRETWLPYFIYYPVSGERDTFVLYENEVIHYYIIISTTEYNLSGIVWRYVTLTYLNGLEFDQNETLFQKEIKIFSGFVFVIIFSIFSNMATLMDWCNNSSSLKWIGLIWVSNTYTHSNY